MTLMNEVMIRVRRIFLFRRLAIPSVFAVVAVAVVASTVSISHVIANMPSLSSFVDIPAVAAFFARAFAHADVVVKSALVAGTLFMLMTLKGIIDSIRLGSTSSVLQKA